MTTPDQVSAVSQPPSCALEVAGEEVRLVVGGTVVQALPFAAYDAVEQKLAESAGFKHLPVEFQGATLHIHLVPMEEVRRRKQVPLESRDGVSFGRGYRLLNIVEQGGEKHSAVIADAATGEVVEQVPWTTFHNRVRWSHCRSLTPYDVMLGQHNPRLYFHVVGRLYEPDAAAPKAAQPAAASASPKAPEGETDWRADFRRLRAWCNQHPQAVYGMAAGCLLILISGIALTTGEKKPVLGRQEKVFVATPSASDPAVVEYAPADTKVSEYIRRAENLAAQPVLNNIHRQELASLRKSCQELERQKPGDAAVRRLSEILASLESR